MGILLSVPVSACPVSVPKYEFFIEFKDYFGNQKYMATFLCELSAKYLLAEPRANHNLLCKNNIYRKFVGCSLSHLTCQESAMGRKRSFLKRINGKQFVICVYLG